MSKAMVVLGMAVLCTLASTSVLAETQIQRAFTVTDATVSFDITDGRGRPAEDVTLTDPPLHGSALLGADGRTIVYTPDLGYRGFDAFVCSMTSPDQASTEVLVSVSVADVPVPVVAIEDRVSVCSGSTIDIDVLRNDFSNPLIDTQVWLNIMSVAPAVHGSVELINEDIRKKDDSRIRYVPAPGFCGTDTFTYVTWDQHEWRDGATVFVDVICSGNRAPMAVADDVEVFEGRRIRLDLLANDDDPDGDELCITSVTQPAHAVATVTTEGSRIDYTPPVGWVGMAVFGYTVDDGRGGTDAGLVRVRVLLKENDA